MRAVLRLRSAALTRCKGELAAQRGLLYRGKARKMLIDGNAHRTTPELQGPCYPLSSSSSARASLRSAVSKPVSFLRRDWRMVCVVRVNVAHHIVERSILQHQYN